MSLLTCNPFHVIAHLHLCWEALIKMVQIMEKHNKTFFMETLWTTSSLLISIELSMDCCWETLIWGSAAHPYNRYGIHKVPVQLSAQSYCFLSHLQFLALSYSLLCFPSPVPMLIFSYCTLSQKHSPASLPPWSPRKCLFIF